MNVVFDMCKIWTADSAENPTNPMSFTSALPYIVQIGEHLLALATQLGEAAEEQSEQSEFISQWINLVGTGTSTLLLQKIMEISSLSDRGAEQLSKDISIFWLVDFY